ncbi:MAG: hypothetical protein QF473_22380 [Planctomycetota bacterium]|nr:hypothetical protein [Planctomycetota bacterium]
MAEKRKTYSTISGISWRQPIGGAVTKWSAEDWVAFGPLLSFNIGLYWILFLLEQFTAARRNAFLDEGFFALSCVLACVNALYGMGFARDFADLYGEETLARRVICRIAGNLVPISIVSIFVFIGFDGGRGFLDLNTISSSVGPLGLLRAVVVVFQPFLALTGCLPLLAWLWCRGKLALRTV